MLGETVDKIRSPDEQHFVDKHIVDKKDHPEAEEDQFVSKAKKAKRRADHEDDEAVYEEADSIECPDCGKNYDRGDDHECSFDEEMTEKQMKKREEIVKSMKKKMGEFKDKYGDRAKEVMYATATKMAMKEEVQDLEEAVKAGSMKLKDGSTVQISKDDAGALTSLFGSLNPSNKKKMEEIMTSDKKGFDQIVKFAREAI